MAQSRHKSEIERDRRNIAKLYLSGTTQMDIAEQLKISQATVSRDLKAIEKEWAVARINDIDERKRMELAKIDNLELVYWGGWKKSQADAEVETVKMQGNADKPGKVEKTRRVEGQVGDPRFLQGVAWCVDKRCELLGLNATTKTMNVDMSALSTAQVERIAKGEDVMSVLSNPNK